MSRGPGHVEQFVIAELERNLATHRATIASGGKRLGTSKVLTYLALACEHFGVETPTRAQYESVARACRRIVARDDAYLWNYDDGTVIILPFLDDWHRKTHGQQGRAATAPV